MTTNSNLRIAIIGGGPGGLTLARILLTRGITSTVFELDEHPLSRPQGGSLDLHAESGQLALREAGLEAQFKALARYDDQGGAIYDQDGVLRFQEPESAMEGDRPEIDRTQLRQILIDSLPKETIHWGSKISAVEPLADGRYSVMNGIESLGTFDLVVGADGAWSKVRPLVSKETAAYSGILCIELNIDDVDTQHPELAKLIPHGKIGAHGKGCGFIAQRSSHGQIRVYLMFNVPEEQARQGFIDLSSPERARAAIKALLPGWAPSLLAFVDECNDTINARPIVALPPKHHWAHRSGVTLIGDAAHVMPPFGGEGVNLAMLDALELGLAVAANPDWDAAVAACEVRMLTRSAEVAPGAMQGLLGFASEGGLEHALEHFASMEHPTVSEASGTPKEVFDTRITEKTQSAEVREKVNAVYRFDLSGPNGGTWIVDFKEATAGVRQCDEASQCTVSMTDDNFLSMIAGEFSPRTGFMNGKLKIKGDMGLAMKLSEVLSA